MSQLGVVVIGRNEGERLVRCLESMRALVGRIVYVDSGSTDASVEMSRARGVEVVALDMSVPFTAARARNAGLHRLTEVAPGVERVQFVDGDCEVIEGWLAAANAFLDHHADVACVCGRLRERFPERSVYNRLCDFEWDRDVGQTDACGGIAMMRISVLVEVGGFREDMVAGEEPELCQRIRGKGWKVWRLPDEMAWHDAAMLHFGQWWMRSKRAGFSYAQRIWLLRSTTESNLARQAMRTWLWAAAIPLLILLSVLVFGLWALSLLLVYPLQVVRLARAMQQPWRIRLERAFFLMLGKFPELLGQIQFWLGRTKRRGAASFDYKS
jgi:GT2 family glycosyltransferase